MALKLACFSLSRIEGANALKTYLIICRLKASPEHAPTFSTKSAGRGQDTSCATGCD
jgi:hypothetical protein